MNPLFNLPFMLSALGAGSRGFTNGMQAATDRNRAEDEHMRLIQQMNMANENAGRERQLFPLQLAQSQHANQDWTESHSPNPYVTGAINGAFPDAKLPSGISESDAFKLAPFFARMAANKSRQAILDRQSKLNDPGYKASVEQIRTLKDAAHAANGRATAFEIKGMSRMAPENAPAQIARARIDAKLAQDAVTRALQAHVQKYGEVPYLGNEATANPLDSALLDPTTFDTVPESE